MPVKQGEWSDLQSWEFVAKTHERVGTLCAVMQDRGEGLEATLIVVAAITSGELDRWKGSPHAWRGKPSRKLELYRSPNDIFAGARKYLDTVAAFLSEGEADSTRSAIMCFELFLMELQGVASMLGLELRPAVHDLQSRTNITELLKRSDLL